MRKEATILDKLLKVPEAAAQLGRSRWHIYDLVNAGLLERHYGGVKGNRLQISERDLQKYIDSIKAPPLPKTRESAA